MAIGDRIPFRFAARTADSRPRSGWDFAASGSWWADLQGARFQSPLLTLVAAQVLETRLGPFERQIPSPNNSTFAGPNPPPPSTSRAPDASPSVDAGESSDDADSTIDPDEWFARRRLGRALLQMASTASGHAYEAQVMLERLAPALTADLAEFLERSPRWITATHVFDRALRSPFPPAQREALLAAAVGFVGSERFVHRMAQRPPRAAAALKLARRIALIADTQRALSVANEVSHVAKHTECSARARRYRAVGPRRARGDPHGALVSTGLPVDTRSLSG